MTIERREPPPETSADDSTGRRKARPSLEGFAGPLLIVAAVLVVMNRFWLDPKLTNQQVDLLSFWLPRYCFLGESLANGHIPTWLPHQFGGVPFASDPQSAWLYLPAMALFALTSCARAIGLLIVLNPILAGLGLYLFFRAEGLGRVASTAGGLTLSLAMTGASVVLSLPFAGFLAWTSVALAGAAHYLRSRTTLGFLGWGGVTALAWSQVAGAHLTHGLLMATFILGLYVTVRLLRQIRAGERRLAAAALLAGALFVALPILSAAVLVPRLALLPRTSIGQGYEELARLATALSGTPNDPPFAQRGVEAWWATSFARAPGGYVGALAILLMPSALASRRWRAPALAFASVGLLAYLLNLEAIVLARPIRDFALDVGFGELWLRSPVRFRYPLLIVFAAMAAYGLQAWVDRSHPHWRGASIGLLWLLPAVLLFVLLPLAAGSRPAQYGIFALASVCALPLLLVLARGRAWAGAGLVALLTVELVTTGLIVQTSRPSKAAPNRLEEASSETAESSAFAKFRSPFIDPDDYLTPGPIGRAMLENAGSYGRYLSFYPGLTAGIERGFLTRQGAADWAHHENGRSILLGLDEVLGYSPVQIDRYWRLVRRVDETPIYYNSASFETLHPPMLRLFGVEWVIRPATAEPPPGASRVATEERYALYRLAHPQPRASMVFLTEVAGSPTEALDLVLRPTFDPARTAIVEGGPPLPTPDGPAAPRGSADYREAHPEDVRIRTTATAPGLLVVRNVFDENWRATVDGRPVAVERVDYLLQGVRVPPGGHEVRLTYRDTAIGLGLAISVGAWVVALAAMAWLWARRRRVRRGQNAAD
ncbi:MAG: YfhO family protein [Actinobacteria bacterium]|nr:YfhO family protein [Actinomycetota bacterium]